MIFIGQSSGKTAQIEPWQLTVPNHTVTGFYIGAYLAFPDLIQSTLGEIFGFIMSGKLSLQVGYGSATFAGGRSASALGGQEDDRQGRAAALGRRLSDRSAHLNCFTGTPQADASDVPVIPIF
ncbi:hypothetical protein [Bradyrhizobium sp. 30]|uniref:hypothetical protein n=1 Tax=Bradyrhizobium sp. 30 TaxID=2782669 RepID=UPI001FFC2055|nr:hypothetical protein [Bradyrhizobium sp. 30]